MYDQNKYQGRRQLNSHQEYAQHAQKRIGQYCFHLLLQQIQPADHDVECRQHHKIIGGRRNHFIEDNDQIIDTHHSGKITGT